MRRIANKSDPVTGNRPIIVLSTANYDSDVWTNKQYVASKLAEDRDVFYINSIGLRRPGVNISDFKRIFRRLRSMVEGAPTADYGKVSRPAPPRIAIVNPAVLPFHEFAIVRKLNTFNLNRQLKKKIPDIGNSILWTFSPLTYNIEQFTHATVYHSVDLLHALDHIPKRLLLKVERDLVKSANAVIASSTGVMNHLVEQGVINVLLWENVADTELYSGVDPEREPRAVFAGNLTPQKIDLDILSSIANAGINIDIAGPIDIDGTSDSRIATVLRSPNVRYHGNLQSAELANLLNSSTVGLIPYLINEYTQGVFPLKVYEYLAAGLKIVATPLPSLANHTEIVDMHSDAGSFAATVSNSLSVPDSETISIRRKRADQHSWTRRMTSIRNLIDSFQ